jgi:S1-C subfamily serine protease
VSGLAVLVALCAATTSCNGGSGVDNDALAEATVRVRADGCGPRIELGTGTSIGDGLVVTAAHVVAGADQVEIVDQVGDSTVAEVVWFDPALDVAALRAATSPEPPAPLRSDPASVGETGVIAILADDGSIELVDVEVVQRVTILTTDIYRDEQVQRTGLRVTASIEPGDSGAMVHLEGGGVGIVWSRSTERSDQAWTVDLPDELLSSATRSRLTAPVGTGQCS